MQQEAIIAKINTYQPRCQTETPLSAAVLLLFIVDDDNFFLVLTERHEAIMYAGDYCFPGGMKEPTDADLHATATRETEEELGINPVSYKIIGQLDDTFDRFGNLVRPYAALILKTDFEKQLKKSTTEINEIYYFPLADLNKFVVDENLDKILKRHPAYVYKHNNVFIWGLTAAIMVRLRDILQDLIN